jgi:hypothetical protein
MNLGRVYCWHPQPDLAVGGTLTLDILPLLRLRDSGEGFRLSGRYVTVHNAGAMVIRWDDGEPHPTPLGDALPDENGDFLFDPSRGGGRVDVQSLGRPKRRERYRQAAHFGEVNTYYHLDRMAAYVDALLHELGAASLPAVTVLVNAHHAATEIAPGMRDGVLRSGNWLPFQGGHYRLPTGRAGMEHQPVAAMGEIHLGPGWRLVTDGALPTLAGRAYRANASHNVGIQYHEYAHHLCRHTADFCANAQRDRGAR